MGKQFIFNFKTDLSSFKIPSNLNNPFSAYIPEISKIAAKEFQEFITLESKMWDYDFGTQRGKMFGILVVKKQDNTYCYLGAVSAKLPKMQFVKNLYLPYLMSLLMIFLLIKA